MKTNEFVKKFGLSKAKKIVIEFNYNSSNKFITSLKDNSAINIYDLKLLVESHELVESKGGLIIARQALLNNAFNPNIDNFVQLKQAIADVESCQ